ncbi:MAG: aminotransferase class IV [Nitrospirae bacterium]|nr:aminotransferase class IV [Candidatus Troglogloeales bacterium]
MEFSEDNHESVSFDTVWVYLNNHFVSQERAIVSVFDQGFLYGDGLFETLRSYNGKIFLLSEHLRRLQKGAKRLGIIIPKAEQLEQLLYATLSRNSFCNAMIRITVTRGAREWQESSGEVIPTLVIFARRFEGYPDKLYKKGIAGCLSTIRRNAKASQDPALKSISFLNNVMARREANALSTQEAILLNPEGFLAEGSVSNLFWVRAGMLYTPGKSVGILEGVTREIVVKLAQKERIPITRGFYRKGALYNADEAFLTNTGYEIMPLTRVDQKKIGTGQPGPITTRLRQLFFTQLPAESALPSSRPSPY